MDVIVSFSNIFWLSHKHLKVKCDIPGNAQNKHAFLLLNAACRWFDFLSKMYICQLIWHSKCRKYACHVYESCIVGLFEHGTSNGNHVNQAFWCEQPGWLVANMQNYGQKYCIMSCEDCNYITVPVIITDPHTMHIFIYNTVSVYFPQSHRNMHNAMYFDGQNPVTIHTTWYIQFWKIYRRLHCTWVHIQVNISIIFHDLTLGTSI